MKKTTLEFEPDYSFRLLAIAGNIPGYKLAWLLEKKLNLTLQRIDELKLTSKRKGQESFFQVFVSEETEDSYVHWTLIGNKSSGSYLIPEQKAVDFYLKVEGDVPEESYLNVFNTLKEIADIQLVFDVNPEQLKSKANLIL